MNVNICEEHTDFLLVYLNIYSKFWLQTTAIVIRNMKRLRLICHYDDLGSLTFESSRSVQSLPTAQLHLLQFVCKLLNLQT